MLNYFWWYSISWIVVLFLYLLNFSDFNMPLDLGIIFFAFITSLVSALVGWVFRDRFKVPLSREDKSLIAGLRERTTTNKNKKRVTRKQILLFFTPLIIVIVFAILEFIIIGQVPLFKVIFLKEAYYQDVDFIPFYHVALMISLTYIAIGYIYEVIFNKNNRKYAAIAVLMSLPIFLLYLSRSYVVIISFVGLIMLASYLITKYGIKLKYIAVSIVIVLLGLFGFGIFGNIRHGYDWNDASFLEQIGLYESWPQFVPKQMMWAYSYMTTPLANLNFNVVFNKNDDFNLFGITNELLPDSVTKYFIGDGKRNVSLIRPYFTASTGYARVYLNGGFLGMYIMFGFLMLVGVLGVLIGRGRMDRFFMIFAGLLCATYAFMMFDNMLAYVGLALPCLISFIILVWSRFKEHK